MDKTTEEKFQEFHQSNPHVYNRMVELTRSLVDKGHRKVGISMIFEVLRWQHLLETDDPNSKYKLCNNYKPYYSRLIMAQEPELDGVFDTKKLFKRRRGL